MIAAARTTATPFDAAGGRPEQATTGEQQILAADVRFGSVGHGLFRSFRSREPSRILAAAHIIQHAATQHVHNPHRRHPIFAVMAALDDGAAAELSFRLQSAVAACSERGLWQSAKW